MFIMTVPVFKFALRKDLLDRPDFLPAQGEPHATGWDVRAGQLDRKPLSIQPGCYFSIPLGFRIFAPPNWWIQLNPRSSTFAKKFVHALYGVIDEQYENEIVFAGQYMPNPKKIPKDLVINFGDKIGQIIPVFRQTMIVDSIGNEEYDKFVAARGGKRGTGGFGSTDKK